MNILIAEDDLISQHLLKTALTNLGHEVSVGSRPLKGNLTGNPQRLIFVLTLVL